MEEGDGNEAEPVQFLESFGGQTIDFCCCYNIGVVQAMALDISPDRKG